MALAKTKVRDKKTGRVRTKDPKRVKAGKLAAKKRRGKPLSAAVKKKISKAVKRTAKTGKTVAGRRAIKRKMVKKSK